MTILYQLFIAPIEWGMHGVLSTIYEAIGSYGISIFLLSFLINVALLPLFQMAERWQEAERNAQKILAPKLQELRKAFSGEERHAMIQTLYRQAGYHPIYAMRSSFGLLLQLPFWIAAYQLLSQYQPLNGASFLVFKDLGKPDGLLAGMNVLPFVMTGLNLGAAFVYTKSLSRKEQIQPVVLALLFLTLLYSSPAGLLLYWTFNSLFSLLRIGLIDRRQATGLTPGTQPVSTSKAISPSGASLVRNHSGAVGQLSGASKSVPGPIPDNTQWKITHFLALPWMHSFALFLIVIASQISVHLEPFASEGGIFDKTHAATKVVAGTSLVLLAYLCLAFSWGICRGTDLSLRQQVRVALVWLLFGAITAVDLAWLFETYSNLHPARAIAGSLLVFFLLLYVSPMCNRISILADMPNSPWLYVISTLLMAFVVFVANPISFYISSHDFVGGVYGLASTLLLIFVGTVLVHIALYLLMDQSARGGLTLLSVFSAVCVIAYSALGVKDGGIMTQFMLAFPQGLRRTNQQIITEVVVLLAVLGGTSYATLKFRQNVTYVIGAMLVTSACVTTVDLHQAKGAAASESKDLPADHADIVGFSRERNILIIMLDGFPGGYLQKVMDEMPEALKGYEGFTWYPNTLSTNINTMGAIATLAGGPRYAAQEINSRNYDSIGTAIAESYGTYIEAFVPKGYQVTYVNPAFVDKCDRLDNRIHCIDTSPYGIYYHEREEPNAPLLQGESHIPLILAMVSLLKVSPYFMKSLIYDDERYLGANSTSVRHAAANTSKVMEGWGFLHVLARESNVDNTSKTFKFIQLNIPHWPNALNRECRLNPAHSSIFTESVCALKEIGMLLAWMKKMGIYDVTKIVIVSDHGYYIDNPMFPGEFAEALPKIDGFAWLPGLLQPLLLVKDFDAKGDFRRSDIFLSNSDVPSIVCSAAEKCKDVGPDPLTHSLGSRKLSFAVTSEPPELTEAKQFDIKLSFEVKNNIFSMENWTRTR